MPRWPDEGAFLAPKFRVDLLSPALNIRIACYQEDLTIGDVMQSNGVIHVIDTVLLPA
jgi:uncharacterized surface protein with fasciclin (FAS1) repeats